MVDEAVKIVLAAKDHGAGFAPVAASKI
jgi:hypothetical protein